MGEFGECSKFCGSEGGIQARDVSCLMINITGSDRTNQTVDDEICTAQGLTRPLSTRVCNARRCPSYAIGALGPVCTALGNPPFTLLRLKGGFPNLAS